jgi:hypothetical protein
MGSQEQHALALLENLRRLYETEDCFLSDVTLLARDGQIKGREACHQIWLLVGPDPDL